MALELGDQIGEGGFCHIFRAEVERREVAVKLLRPREDFEGEEEWQAAGESLEREARYLQLLAGHPAVPELVRWIPAERQLCLELFEECLGDMSSLDIDVAQLVPPIIAGLRHIHASGIVHRDVHPANLMRRASGTWALIDFGLAAPVGTRQVAGTMLFQSVANMARKPACPKDDLESFAYTLWDATSFAGLPWRQGPQTQLAIRRMKLSSPAPEELEALVSHCRAPGPVDYSLALQAAALLCPPPTPSETTEPSEETAPADSLLGGFGRGLVILGSVTVASLALGGLGGLGLAAPLTMKVASAAGAASSVKAASAFFAPALVAWEALLDGLGVGGK